MTVEDARREYRRGQDTAWIWVVLERLEHTITADLLSRPRSAYWWAGLEDGLSQAYAAVEVLGDAFAAWDAFTAWRGRAP